MGISTSATAGRPRSRGLRPLVCLAALALLCAGSTGCATHRHFVGAGPGGHGKVHARQYYLFWGLVQLNEADSQRLAGQQSGYEIVTYYSWTDLVLTPFLFPLLTSSRTVTVHL